MAGTKKNDISKIKIAAAPWHLTGTGYMLLYRFSRKEIQTINSLSDKFKRNFIGGFGAVMLVDYSESDVGPYGELLFIPGRFRYGKKKRHSIAKIYVSTQDSVYNGRKNWAIPKEAADFSFTRNNEKREDRIEVHSGKKKIFSILFREKFLRFPVNTAFLPFPLVQEMDGQAYYTKFSGRGMGRFVSIQDIECDPDMFPDIRGKRPFAAIKISPFRIIFPVAEVGEIE